MNSLEKLEWSCQIVKTLFKLLIKEFETNKKHWIHKVFGCILIAKNINFIYTILFYENDSIFLFIAISYFCAAFQVNIIMHFYINDSCLK